MATYHLRVKNDTQPSGTKISAKRHVDYILREDGKSHADYINREGAQGEKTDCVFKGSQLPKWAKDSPQKFFEAATRYESKGNRRYKEIELSLPNELSLEQNRTIVDKFLANHLANHYYAYAIHEKAGELSGERHPHVHIMFSERLIDDVEKIKERPACKYFRRAARPIKDEQISSFERRREHGAPKDPKWHDKKYLCELREDFARIQNEVLSANGYSIRVDHRSLEVQSKVAEINGDFFLSKVCKRMPESYIGIMSAHQDDALTEDVKRYRRNVQIRQHSFFQADLQQKMAEEFDAKFLVRRAEYEGLSLINSDVYKALDKFDESLRNLNQAILSGLAKIKQLKRNFVSVSSAREKAQSEYLTDAEKKLFWDYKSKLGERHNLAMLLRELQALNADKPKQYTAFQVIESDEQYRSLKRQHEQATAHSYRLMFQVISPQRAMTIAQNIFVQGGFKKLRSEQESYQKALAKYERDVSENRKREKFFQNANWTNLGVKLQEQYYITKEKIKLEETGERLSNIKIQLDSELTRLERLCQTQEAQEKIALIAADFLRKNLKIVLEYEEARKRVGDLYEKLQEAKKRFNAFDEGYRSLKQNRVYRVIQPESNSNKISALKENELAAIIADALLGETYAVQLVALSSGNNLEMEKDWEMMTEFDKDEIINKKIVREL